MLVCEFEGENTRLERMPDQKPADTERNQRTSPERGNRDNNLVDTGLKGAHRSCTIIYETDDKVVIAAIKPTVAMQMIDNEKLKKIAADIEIKIKQAIDGIH